MVNIVCWRIVQQSGAPKHTVGKRPLHSTVTWRAASADTTRAQQQICHLVHRGHGGHWVLWNVSTDLLVFSLLAVQPQLVSSSMPCNAAHTQQHHHTTTTTTTPQRHHVEAWTVLLASGAQR
jgi:hypothetical protein